MNLKDNQDPLIRLAWLATRIQKRIGIGAATNKQLLCWKTTLGFYSGAERSTSRDKTALTLGLAATLEEELTRKDDAAAKKHRDGQSLSEACIEFATHFADEVWGESLPVEGTDLARATPGGGNLSLCLARGVSGTCYPRSGK